MFINLYSRKITVFLAAASPDIDDIREELKCVLVKARIRAIDGQGVTTEQADAAMQTADCSIHILGGMDIYSPDGDGYNAPAGVQYRVAKALCSPSFKMFLWKIIIHIILNIRTAAPKIMLATLMLAEGRRERVIIRAAAPIIA